MIDEKAGMMSGFFARYILLWDYTSSFSKIRKLRDIHRFRRIIKVYYQENRKLTLRYNIYNSINTI
jgi:hypothetical protein